MKNIILIIIMLIISLNAISQKSIVIKDTKSLDDKINEKIQKKTLNNAQVGDLISLDEFGNYILATGSPFEKILGFTTNAPYVTPNKPKNPNDSRVEFVGIVSTENGPIKENDKLCPSSKYPGKVKKCTDNEIPYAIAQENAFSERQKIKVKVLGFQRNR